MNLKRGFTLLELLVVIAVIGILSSVIITALSSSKAKANIASIQTELTDTKNQAELYYATNGNYGTGYWGNYLTGENVMPVSSCSTDGQAIVMFKTGPGYVGDVLLGDLLKGMCKSGATALTAGVDNTSVATKWALAVTAPNNTYFCIDNSTSSILKAASVYNVTSGFCH